MDYRPSLMNTHFTPPSQCAECPRLRAWSHRLNSIQEDINAASQAIAEVFWSSDIEQYMRQVDNEEGYHRHLLELGKTSLSQLTEQCTGLARAADVIDDTSMHSDGVNPLIIEYPVCGVPNDEWDALDSAMLYLPLEGEDD
jgi:hypothetical protein